jgi:hypothetical protein
MGFDVQGIKFLLAARRSGVRFDRTAMIGRQELFIDPVTLHRLLHRSALPASPAETERLLTEANGYAEPLLRRLGAQQITSVDASHYEQASYVHDMNNPIPDSVKSEFSAVIDAGTLEHVFNFPVALRNCMEMVQEGGHLLLMTPANNFMGHGFYQFSPELFFRVLSADNGYEMVRAVVCETSPDAPWYEVVDPAMAGRRVEMLSSAPMYLLIQARRARSVPVLEVTPQQSDYTVLWQHNAGERRGSPSSGPSLPLRAVRGIARRLGSAYRKVAPTGLQLGRRRPDSTVFIPVAWDRPKSSTQPES